ncbi:hypothetical protein DFH28DRAFT_1222022 [Melampsora americana]|nr:hypothetical protein DFH28DRAFT_1222022 [Melampsora americana]
MGLARTPPPRPITSSPIKPIITQNQHQHPSEPKPSPSPSKQEPSKPIEPTLFNSIASSPPIQTNPKLKCKFITKTNPSNSKKPSIIKPSTLIPKPTDPPPTPNHHKRLISNDLIHQDPFKKNSKLQRSPPTSTSNLHHPPNSPPPQSQSQDPQAIPSTTLSQFQPTTHPPHPQSHLPQSHLIKPSSIPVLIRPPSPTKLSHESHLPIPSTSTSTSTLPDHRIQINCHPSSDLTEQLHPHQHLEYPSHIKDSSPSLTHPPSGSTVGIYLQQPLIPDPSNQLKEELSKIQIESKLQRETILESQTRLIEQSKELSKEIEKRKSTEERLNQIEFELNQKLQKLHDLESLKPNQNLLEDHTEISTETVLINGLSEKEKMMYEDRIHQLEARVQQLEYLNHQLDLTQDAKEHEVQREALWAQTGLDSESDAHSPKHEPERLAKVREIEHRYDLLRTNTVISDLECQLKISSVDQELLKLRLESQERDRRSIVEKVEKFQSDLNRQHQRLISELNQLNVKDQEWAKIGAEFEGLLEIERREKEELKESIVAGIEPKIELNSLKYEMSKVEQNLRLAESEVKKVEQNLHLSELEVGRLKIELSNSESRVNSLEDDLNGSKLHVKELVTENQSLRRAHHDLNQTYEIILTELKESHSVVSEMEEQIGTLNRQLRISHRESREHSNSLQSVKKPEEFNKNETGTMSERSNPIHKAGKPLGEGSKKNNVEVKGGKKSNVTVTKKVTGKSRKGPIRSDKKADDRFEVISDSEHEEREIDLNRMITNGGWISISGCITKPDQPPEHDEDEDHEIGSMNGSAKEEPAPPTKATKATRGRKKAAATGSRAKPATKPIKGRPRKPVLDPVIIEDHESPGHIGKISTPLLEGHSPRSELDLEGLPSSPAALSHPTVKKANIKGKGKAESEEEGLDEDVNVRARKRNREEREEEEEEIGVKKIKGRKKQEKEGCSESVEEGCSEEKEEGDGEMRRGVKKVKGKKKKERVEDEGSEGCDEEAEEEKVEEVREGKGVKKAHVKNVKPRARAKVVKKKVVEENEKEEVLGGGGGGQEEGGAEEGATATATTTAAATAIDGIGNPTSKKRKIFGLKNHHRVTGVGPRILNWSGNQEDLDNDQNMLGLPPELSPVKRNETKSNEIGILLLGKKVN